MQPARFWRPLTNLATDKWKPRLRVAFCTPVVRLENLTTMFSLAAAYPRSLKDIYADDSRTPALGSTVHLDSQANLSVIWYVHLLANFHNQFLRSSWASIWTLQNSFYGGLWLCTRHMHHRSAHSHGALEPACYMLLQHKITTLLKKWGMYPSVTNTQPRLAEGAELWT